MNEIPPAALSAASRLGCSLDFVRLHWGPHICVDSRRYESRCLVTDPERETEFLGLISAWPAARPNPIARAS